MAAVWSEFAQEAVVGDFDVFLGVAGEDGGMQLALLIVLGNWRQDGVLPARETIYDVLCRTALGVE